MSRHWIPLRWPEEWTGGQHADLLKESPFNCLLVKRRAPWMEKLPLTVVEGDPPGIAVLKGAWPGVRTARAQGRNQVDSGPTGAPWVDANGWRLRLSLARSPEQPAWIAADPIEGSPVERYLLAVADASAFGGRWIVTLDARFRKAIEAGESQAGGSWRQLCGAVEFFARHQAWNSFEPQARFAIVSDFTGPNEFLSQELLNLTGRQHQPYRIVGKSGMTPVSLSGIAAAIYPDSQAPSGAVRAHLLAFVQEGGLLIAGPAWGAVEDGPGGHPRYAVAAVGRGRVAVARGPLNDPFQAATDAHVLMSHRADVVRFWNAGSCGSFLTLAPGGRSAVLHVIQYAPSLRGDPISLRVAGPWQTAKIWTLDAPAAVPAPCQRDGDGLEVHLPDFVAYAAVEF